MRGGGGCEESRHGRFPHPPAGGIAQEHDLLPVRPYPDHLFQRFDLFSRPPGVAGLVGQVAGDLGGQPGGEALFGQAARPLVLDDGVAVDGIGGAAERGLLVFGPGRQSQRLQRRAERTFNAHAQVLFGVGVPGNLADGLGQVLSGDQVGTHGCLLAPVADSGRIIVQWQRLHNEQCPNEQ